VRLKNVTLSLNEDEVMSAYGLHFGLKISPYVYLPKDGNSLYEATFQTTFGHHIDEHTLSNLLNRQFFVFTFQLDDEKQVVHYKKKE
jgi:hypothetical protein